MVKITTLTQARLKEALVYDKITGNFTNRLTRGSRAVAGSLAGTLRVDGYVEIGLDGENYLAHRLAWFYETGAWPSDRLDHQNGHRSDNSWDNLRDASPLQNIQNSGVYSNNKSGYKGVTWHKANQKWRATIRVNKKALHLGYFETPKAATEAYNIAAQQHFGAFYRKV